MNAKSLHTLELPKIMERLASFAAFSASKDLARDLRPTTRLSLAQRLQAETSEARLLLSQIPTLTIGGARDVRPAVESATRGAVLEPSVLLDIKHTLLAGRNIQRIFEKGGPQFPRLAEIAGAIEPCKDLVDAIDAAVDARAEVVDGASPELRRIRRDLRLARERLTKRLQQIISDTAIVHLLQEPIITQREGRFVVPLRAEFKGRLEAVIHDQSSSGATLFVEPLQIVEQNNAVRELELAERDEVRRILAELSGLAAKQAKEIGGTVEALAVLDLAFAKARFAHRLEAVEPMLKEFGKREASHPGSTLKLQAARHPLLDPESVVPIDVVLDDETFALVITGPNTGGKTVALKTVGLLVLMAQCGLHVPAEQGCELSVFENVHADIGDEQSIEQSLSTFSGHVSNIIAILKEADERSLILLDELGAGTDPQEGAALARAILATLLERRVTTLVATHYPEMKTFAHVTPGVQNASVEFDVESLLPTYNLTIGLPGRSNALAIAGRLGLERLIIERAKSMIDPEELRAESLLDEIHRQRDATQQARKTAERERSEAQSLRENLSARLSAIDDERRDLLQASRDEATKELEAVREELRRLRGRLKLAAQPLDELRAIETEIETVAKVLTEPISREGPDIEEDPHAFGMGDRVLLRTLGKEGTILDLGSDQVEVQIGALRVRTHVSELTLVEAASADSEAGKRPKSRSDGGRKQMAGAAPSMEIDLRGMVVDEALMELERRLDEAFLAGMPFLRVIHGKGTGRLRQAIRMSLESSPYCAGFEPGGQGEGGDGVTIIHITPG